VTSSDKVMTAFFFEEVTFSFILSATSFTCFITTSLTSSMFAILIFEVRGHGGDSQKP
jgi:hypothetical protein